MSVYAPHPASAAIAPTPPATANTHTGPGPSAGAAHTPQAASTASLYVAQIAADGNPPLTAPTPTTPTPTPGAPGTPATHGSQARASLLPHDTLHVPAEDSLQSTPQRNHEAARTEAAETAGPQLMEGMGLSFLPSALRTVALPHVHPHTASAALGHHTAEHMAEPTAQPATTGGDGITARATIHPTVTAWRLWTESSWPLLLNIEGQRDKLAEPAVRFSEELIDHGFHPGVAPHFAAYAGANLPPAEILPPLAMYRDRKNLIPNFELGLFAPYEQRATTATTTATLPPPTDSPNALAADTASIAPPPPPSGPGRRPAKGGTAASPLNAEPATAEHIHKLTGMLTETLIKNDRLRQNIVPPLLPAETDKLLHEQLPYSCWSSIATIFK